MAMRPGWARDRRAAAMLAPGHRLEQRLPRSVNDAVTNQAQRPRDPALWAPV
jgi:hypothetical protein